MKKTGSLFLKNHVIVFVVTGTHPLDGGRGAGGGQGVAPEADAGPPLDPRSAAAFVRRHWIGARGTAGVWVTLSSPNAVNPNPTVACAPWTREIQRRFRND